ncbi:hypothetical protein A3D06_00880 [Candidatus Roizmanbacteria bacterium RIFCSPHIGHO2_02_FULL_40_9]|uniref:NTP pyrophosphohydrolase MazG-like domain-containing protein n=1 Tax=Candidatus Roizmanbacteria bacterium RIFCSPHIGHO2_02_FULL_40_9 TaxID=1802042 RepID=A0A1F7HDB0_9BACT|nr:MAG: hypothetical protein A3D06_00880 [Candidatus Roizmanbacteria bacterium RIFCSPHIGHO2_02_FULL_40_9]
MKLKTLKNDMKDQKEHKMTIQDIQKILRDNEQVLRIKFATLTKKEKDILMRTVKLQEEVGELANDILSSLTLQRSSKLKSYTKENLREEFADVVLTAVGLSNALNVDLDKALKKKLQKILSKYIYDK